MTHSTELAIINQNIAESDYCDAFSDVGEIDAFELKKDHLAAQMAALMAFSGKTRAELMGNLGWKKSRVSNVMSGKCNLTIKTVWEFASSLGFDFDVVFHASGHSPQNQPWQIMDSEIAWIPTFPILEIQSPHQVARDLMNGDHKDVYISLRMPEVTDSFSIGVSYPFQNYGILSSTAIQVAITR